MSSNFHVDNKKFYVYIFVTTILFISGCFFSVKIYQRTDSIAPSNGISVKF